MTEKSISEYGYIYKKDKKPTNLNDKFIHCEVDEKEFNELYRYWQEDDEAKKVLEYDGYCLKAKNYVGVIQTQRLSLEILPKIYDKTNEDKTRNIFIEMLKPLLGINEVQINKANLSTMKDKNIYEIFISMFVEYLDILIHKGLKSHYIAKEDNQFFLKGKLKFNEHIKRNYIHKERFYVEFDEYMQNRAENRLLKSTIKLLLKKTNRYENKRALRQQLFIFDDVHFSSNHTNDISKINLHRGMEYYEIPLQLAKIFLTHKSFTSMRGSENVFALLFPMEKVFENYMEFILNNSKEQLGIKNVLVNGGKNEYLLSDGECQMVRLQPDYLLKMNEGKDIVTDAKWKVLEAKEDETNNCNTINISSQDVYQIFSYLYFYDCLPTAYIFAPFIENEEFSELEYLKDAKEHNVIKQETKKLKIIPIKLSEVINNGHKLDKECLQLKCF